MLRPPEHGKTRVGNQFLVIFAAAFPRKEIFCILLFHSQRERNS